MDRQDEGIYVEIVIRGDLKELWEKTQDPLLHQQWDLRFSKITYLPRPLLTEPQRFLYSTRIGFGFAIDGTGESMGTISTDGERTSSLRFASDHPLSLIKEGSGYWKYIAVDGGVRFLTWYNYEPRFGALGQVLDRIAFRPLLGWATAWSFDRLRLWVEDDLAPAASARLSLIYAVTRLTLGGVWIYHGLVPKLIYKHPDEFAPLLAAGFSMAQAIPLVQAAGIAEIGAGLALVFFWRVQAGFWITIGLMTLALLSVAWTVPRLLTAAFNPVSLNLSMIALSLIGLVAGQKLPSAARCSRFTQPI